MQIQNLGLFSVQGVLFGADVWAVTMRGNQLLNITDISIEQVTLEIFVLWLSLFTDAAGTDGSLE